MSSECGDPGSRDTTTSCLLLFGLGVVLVVGTSDEGGSCFWTGKRLAPKVGVDGRCRPGTTSLPGRQRERAALQFRISTVFITFITFTSAFA